MAQIHVAELDTAKLPGRFSPREVIAHLADWEPILRARIRSAMDQPGCTISAYDEGERALTLGYANWSVEKSIEMFKSERFETVDLVVSCSPALYRNFVIHPERGEQSLIDLANIMVGHDMYHIEQLSHYL